MGLIHKKYAHLNTSDSGSLHKKLDATEAYVTGSLFVGEAATLNSTLDVADMAKFGEATAVTALVNMSTGFGYVVDVAVEKDIVIGGSGSFMGDVSLQGVLAVNGSSSFAGVLKANDRGNPVDIGEELVPFNAIYANEIHAQTLSASQHLYSQGDLVVQASGSILGRLEVTGYIKSLANEISASGNLSAGENLYVFGTAEVKNTLNVLSDKFIVDSAATTLKNIDFEVKNVSSVQKFFVDSETGDTEIQGTLKGRGAATFYAAGTGLAVSHNASVGGNLYVAGDLNIEGSTVTLDATTIQLADKNIDLGKVSGAIGNLGTDNNSADGAGLTIMNSGSGDIDLIWEKETVDGHAPSFTVNADWSPALNESQSLGQSGQRWNFVYAKDGEFTDVTATGTVSLGAVDVDSLAVTTGGAATFGGGIAVTGTGSFTQQLSSSAAIKGLSLDVAETATFGGMVDLNDGATVPAEKTLTIAAGAFLQVDGTANYLNLSATGQVAAAHLSASAGAEITGSLFVVGPMSSSEGATAASFQAAGLANFGSLVVGGINISPISASVTTLDNAEREIFSFPIAEYEMMKLELEVIARGAQVWYQHDGLSTNYPGVANLGASWKISITAMHDGDSVVAAASEIVKEFFGALGMKLDVKIEEVAGNIVITAVGTSNAQGIFWDAQVTKKMVMSNKQGTLTYP